MRINASALRAVNEAVFGGYTGKTTARRMGVKHVTLWSYLNRRGIPVEHAEALSGELTQRAMELLDASQQLQREVSRARAASG